VPEWSAEVVVDAEWARRLIARQFPELELGSTRLLGEGWDNTVWLVDERWVFRFPRRAIAVAAVGREVAVLARLTPLVPLPIPTPIFDGHPADGYPWPFFGAALLPGREVADADLGDAARIRLAQPLGAFLAALHAVEIETVTAGASDLLRLDPMRRGDMAFRVPRAVERLAEVERLGLWSPPARVRRLLDEATELGASEARSLAHGDLHVRHLLVDEDAAPAGIIDWDDVCIADPAIDLPLFWSFLPPEGRQAFREAYGSITQDQLLRARVLALFLSATLAAYARHEGLGNLEREAIAGLHRAAAD
jgi:aminoglycoside phosphotransferase (APT) family kinase protein